MMHALTDEEDRVINQDLLEGAREELATRRYAVLRPDVIISAADRLKLCSAVFHDARLEADQPDMHPNRNRADAVLKFAWRGSDIDLGLGPNPSADPETRQVVRYTANHEGDREYLRLKALDIPELRKLLVGILNLIPRESRREKGLLGVHALRTFGDVVFVRHRDGSADAPVDWVASYVASKSGDGAETQLTIDQDGKLLIARAALAGGQLLVHHDATFFHYVTPLVSGSTGGKQRDAVVITIRPDFE